MLKADQREATVVGINTTGSLTAVYLKVKLEKVQWKRRVMLTCGEARFNGRIRGWDADWEGGSWGRRRLCPRQGAVSWEGDWQAGSLHGGLIVSELMNPLLLQQQGLLLIHTETSIKKMNSTVVMLSCLVKRLKCKYIREQQGEEKLLQYIL